MLRYSGESGLSTLTCRIGSSVRRSEIRCAIRATIDPPLTSCQPGKESIDRRRITAYAKTQQADLIAAAPRPGGACHLILGSG
jgi:hypothetical protein